MLDPFRARPGSRIYRIPREAVQLPCEMDNRALETASQQHPARSIGYEAVTDRSSWLTTAAFVDKEADTGVHSYFYV